MYMYCGAFCSVYGMKMFVIKAGKKLLSMQIF